MSYYFLLLPVNVLLFVLADWFSVKWFESGNVIYMILVAVFGITGYWIFGLISHHNTLSIASGLINTGIVVGSILAGVFLRHDSLDFQQKIGISIAVLAIGLLTIHR